MEIKIKQEQANEADKILSIFEQLVNIKKEYPHAYKFLKDILLPDYSDRQTLPSREAIRTKVITEVYIQDDINKERQKESIKKRKSEITRT